MDTPNAQMTIADLQRLVARGTPSSGVRSFSPWTHTAVLAEEAGEVARLMARLYGDQSFKEGEDPSALGDELADVLWVVAAIANQTGVDLDEALRCNIAKKTARDANRHRDNPKLKQ